MGKIKKMVAITLVLAFGCGAPIGPGAEAKSSNPGAKTTAAPAPTKTTPAKEAPAKRDQRLIENWDFRNLDKSKWDWKIPGSDASSSPKGATFTVRKSGTGPANMNVGVKAQDVSEIRVRMSAMRKGKDGKDTPVKLGLIAYWAREGDAAAAKNPAWPFDLKRAIGLKPDPNEPDVYVAAVKRHQLWNETIECLYVGIDVPSATESPNTDCTVTLGEVQLLK